MKIKQLILIDPATLDTAQYDFLDKLNGEKGLPIIISKDEIQQCLDVTLVLSKENKKVINCQGCIWTPDYKADIKFMRMLLKQEFEFIAIVEGSYDSIADYWNKRHNS